MFQTENRLPIDVADRRVNNRLIAASMLLTGLIAYALVVLQPGLVGSVDGLWTRTAALASGNPRWVVPALATSIAIGGASLAMLLLSAFVSGVQYAPYRWLAPVLIGFSTLVLSRVHVQLPVSGISPPLLSALAGLLLLGGGALVQMHGIACVISGASLLLLPVSALAASYVARAGGTAHAAWAALDAPSALYMFVLSMTSIGIAIVAFVARPSAAGDALRAAARMRQQLVAAQERARLLELDLHEVEHRAKFAEHELRARGFGGRVDTDAFVLLARPPIGRQIGPLVIAALVVAIPLAVYLGIYRPLTRRIAAQQAFAAEAASEHADQIQALRKRINDERANTLAMLAAAHDRIDTARAAAAEQPRAQESAAAPALTTPTPAPAPHTVVKAEATAVQRTAPVEQKARAIPARHALAKKHSAARAAAKRTKKAAAAPAKPDASSAGADQDASKVLNERVNDDPIGGLDAP